MKILRLYMSIFAVLFLFLGYLASQLAALDGPVAQAAYATKADAFPVRAIASLIFFGALILALIPDKEPST